MESQARTHSHSGWQTSETDRLFTAVRQASAEGVPLRTVFEQLSGDLGRKPNSIRNYYYACLRQQPESAQRSPAFRPFTPEETHELLRQVLMARGKGMSVRACVMEMSQGSHSRMLRYQNKYRSVIKSRPEYVQTIVDQLQAEGVSCTAPSVNHRSRVDLREASAGMTLAARRTGDADLVRACEALQRLMDGCAPDLSALTDAANRLIDPVKEFAARSRDEQHATLGAFIQALVDNIGAFEAALPADTARP